MNKLPSNRLRGRPAEPDGPRLHIHVLDLKQVDAAVGDQSDTVLRPELLHLGVGNRHDFILRDSGLGAFAIRHDMLEVELAGQKDKLADGFVGVGQLADFNQAFVPNLCDFHDLWRAFKKQKQL